jgi:hypothetical protein
MSRIVSFVGRWLGSIANGVRGLFGGKLVTEAEPVPPHLLWVKDAPLYIDDLNVGRFYDAALRPPFDDTSPLKLKLTEATKRDLSNKLGGKFTAGLSNWLSFLASASAEVSAERQKTTSESQGSEEEIILQPIRTAHRQLEQLTIFYLLRRTEQLLFGSNSDVAAWQAGEVGLTVPRPLVFIDFPKRTKFIPMAAEFTNGKVVTFFDKLLADNGERPPPYKQEDKAIYWKWFDDHYSAERAISVLEAAASEQGKIEWIDFRVPLNDVVETVHLHIEVAGKYSTGTFAYRMIRRGQGHGMRVVGSLRDGPDVNVLALYEK